MSFVANSPRVFFVGSLPFQSVSQAIAFVEKVSSSTHPTPSLPFLPQLPECNPEEDMYGQMLRGLELGYWDARACAALEMFQNVFGEHKEIKLQAAGPLSLSRMMSCSFEKVYSQWLSFWSGMSLHLRQGSIGGKIWLQIDEPLMNAATPLPASYSDFLDRLRSLGEIHRLGIHSCAPERPDVRARSLQSCDFISLNYLDQPMAEAERADVESYLSSNPQKQFVAGVIGRSETEVPTWLRALPIDQIWISTRCGLYDWSETEVENRFQRSS